MKKGQSTKRSWVAGAIVMVLVIGIASIGYFVYKSREAAKQSNSQNSSKMKQSETANQATAKGTVIKTGDSQYGQMLFDSRGQAIYIWQLEDTSTAQCYGNCAEEWPPVLTDGVPVASGEVNSQLLGTTKRTDGTTQVTYNGHPLYFYAHEKPGEIECHNIRTHGGLWWIIQPNGTRGK